MNVLSLFSGIGGLDLGLERAGMTIAGQVEIDPWCRKVLAKHWPEVPRHDDVRTAVDWWGDRRAPDLVAGGFPCQPVSLAGKGLAQADSRWLWPAFAGIIRDLRPRYVLVENVPGLLGRGMGDVLGDLASIGYDAEWDCVPAVFVGAPHIRNRVWVIAHPDSASVRQRRARRHDRVGTTGLDSPVSDACRQQLRDEPGRRNGASWPRAAVAGDDGASQPLADTAGSGRHGRSHRVGTGRNAGVWSQAGGHAADRSQVRRLAEHWRTEPDVGRVAHGVPRRVDRLRGLGNAVVPQVAEHIGRLILAATP